MSSYLSRPLPGFPHIRLAREFLVSCRGLLGVVGSYDILTLALLRLLTVDYLKVTSFLTLHYYKLHNQQGDVGDTYPLHICVVNRKTFDT